mgnify:CR=1 FL=1
MAPPRIANHLWSTSGRKRSRLVAFRSDCQSCGLDPVLLTEAPLLKLDEAFTLNLFCGDCYPRGYGINLGQNGIPDLPPVRPVTCAAWHSQG